LPLLLGFRLFFMSISRLKPFFVWYYAFLFIEVVEFIEGSKLKLGGNIIYPR